MAIIKKIVNNECWWGCGETATPKHYCWEWKMVRHLCKPVWATWSSDSTPTYIPNRTESRDSDTVHQQSSLTSSPSILPLASSTLITRGPSWLPLQLVDTLLLQALCLELSSEILMRPAVWTCSLHSKVTFPRRSSLATLFKIITPVQTILSNPFPCFNFLHHTISPSNILYILLIYFDYCLSLQTIISVLVFSVYFVNNKTGSLSLAPKNSVWHTTNAH